MAHEIRVPRLGWSMEEGSFVGWLKQPGDQVNVGDPLYELEGEKATQAIEAVDSGVLQLVPESPEPGCVVTVGSLLGYLCGVGEQPPRGVEPPNDANGNAAASESRAMPTTASPSGPIAIQVATTGAAAQTPRPTATVATPRARRIARELGVEWTELAGSGRGGRVRETDVRAAAAAGGRSTEPSASAGEIIVLSARRRTIAERLRASRERTVPVTLATLADATRLVRLRASFQALQATNVPAYTDLIACLVKTVLRYHRRFAARWAEDRASLRLPPDGGFHIGIAVDTSDGLLAPVVRDEGADSVLEFAERSRALVARARAGQLAAADMQGGVFTITNLGSYGVDAFTPVINYPETAILGLGAIRRTPVVADDNKLAIRDQISLSLTFDHAAHDGAPAAAMLRDLVAAIESAPEQQPE